MFVCLYVSLCRRPVAGHFELKHFTDCLTYSVPISLIDGGENLDALRCFKFL